MNGKDLKEWAKCLSDDSVIEVRKKAHEGWERLFSLRAVSEAILKVEKDDDTGAEPHDARLH